MKYFTALLMVLASTFTAATDKNTTVTNKAYSTTTLVYKTIGDRQLELDLYLPQQKVTTELPLLIWVHGGAWMRGSKDELIERNGVLATSFLKEGYAIAAVNYRLSGEATFPAPVRDVNDAINFIIAGADDYGFKQGEVAVMGRSAGAHLAALIATSNSHQTDFYLPEVKANYRVAAVVDFFGPSDLVELTGNSGRIDHDAPDSAQAKMLGSSPRVNVALAKNASPTTYIDNNTPPFIIMHGGNDTIVPASQSHHLTAQLAAQGIEHQLFIKAGARHGDPVFDSPKYVNKAVSFIKSHF